MKIKINRLNHVQICIPPGAEEQARQFYGRLLGLREIEKPSVLKRSGGLWFEMGDVQLHIGIEDSENSTKRHPAFEVERLDEIRSYFEQQGVRTRDEADVPFARRFSFFDPFGNRIEFLELV